VKLPIVNRTDKPLTIFMEIYCNEYEVPPGGEAILDLDEWPEAIEVHEGQVSIWDKGFNSPVEINAAPGA
jgi:hypothetical protein